ncbi:MAG: YIP1 family protein [Endomicrobium sp.]|nr:YIP1 family protein [Endomicrobium sp.]
MDDLINFILQVGEDSFNKVSKNSAFLILFAVAPALLFSNIIIAAYPLLSLKYACIRAALVLALFLFVYTSYLTAKNVKIAFHNVFMLFNPARLLKPFTFFALFCLAYIAAAVLFMLPNIVFAYNVSLKEIMPLFLSLHAVSVIALIAFFILMPAFIFAHYSVFEGEDFSDAFDAAFKICGKRKKEIYFSFFVVFLIVITSNLIAASQLIIVPAAIFFMYQASFILKIKTESDAAPVLIENGYLGERNKPSPDQLTDFQSLAAASRPEFYQATPIQAKPVQAKPVQTKSVQPEISQTKAVQPAAAQPEVSRSGTSNQAKPGFQKVFQAAADSVTAGSADTANININARKGSAGNFKKVFQSPAGISDANPMPQQKPEIFQTEIQKDISSHAGSSKPQAIAAFEEKKDEYINKGQEYQFGKIIDNSGAAVDKKTSNAPAVQTPSEQRQASKIGHVSEYNPEEDTASQKEDSERVSMMDVFADSEETLNAADARDEILRALEENADVEIVQDDDSADDGIYDITVDPRDKKVSGKRSSSIEKNSKIELIREFKSETNSIKNRKINDKIEKGFFTSGVHSEKTSKKGSSAGDSRQDDDVYEISTDKKDEK